MPAHILIIEDNASNLELMAYLMRASGFEVDTALTGRQAFDAIEKSKPDLIVCDIQLPDIDGREIAQYIKHQPELFGIPIIAVTALAMVGDRDRMLACGFDGYISKPLEPQTFAQQVIEFLRPHGIITATGAADWSGHAT